MFCELCGKKFGVDAKFCGGCGALRESQGQNLNALPDEESEGDATTGTPFDTKVQILADLWLAVGDEPEWQDFVSSNSLGLSLAFMLAWGPVSTDSTTDTPGEQLVLETFEALLQDGDISEDSGFEDILGVLSVSSAWSGDQMAADFVQSLAKRTFAMMSSDPKFPSNGNATPGYIQGIEAATKRNTPLDKRIEILADYWITYQDEEEEFLEFHCVGLALAYMLANDYLDTEAVTGSPAQELLDQAFELLLKHWGFFEDRGFQHVDEIVGAEELDPNFIKRLMEQARKLKNNGN